MDNTQNMEGLQQGSGADQQNTGNQQQGSEKLFTQEEVSAIVQRRLARANNTQAGTDQAAREQELNRRELQLDARERLADAGISKEYLPLVNCSSKEEMDKSIKLISALMGQQQQKATGYRVNVQPPKRTGKLENFPNGDPDIRAAMGLKG